MIKNKMLRFSDAGIKVVEDWKAALDTEKQYFFDLEDDGSGSDCEFSAEEKQAATERLLTLWRYHRDKQREEKSLNN